MYFLSPLQSNSQAIYTQHHSNNELRTVTLLWLPSLLVRLKTDKVNCQACLLQILRSQATEGQSASLCGLGS